MRSNEASALSALEAAQALATLKLRTEDLNNDKEAWGLMKLAKKDVRDLVLWRSCGGSGGLDSREAVVRQFEAAARRTTCDRNTVSQLTNGYDKITRRLTGGPPTRQRSGSPARTPSQYSQCWARPLLTGGEPQPGASGATSSSTPELGSTTVASASDLAQPVRLPFSIAPGSPLPAFPAMQCSAPPGLETQGLSADNWLHRVELDPVLSQPGQDTRQHIYKAQRALEQALITLRLG